MINKDSLYEFVCQVGLLIYTLQYDARCIQCQTVLYIWKRTLLPGPKAVLSITEGVIKVGAKNKPLRSTYIPVWLITRHMVYIRALGRAGMIHTPENGTLIFPLRKLTLRNKAAAISFL